MDPSTRRRAKDLYLSVLELAPDERDAFLDRECESDEVRKAVESLIAASERAEGELDDLGDGVMRALDAAKSAKASKVDLTGRRIGSYQLDSLLGRGGMGAVYRAERVDGEFRQTVAIKLLSMGATSDETRRRFLAEREILALLQHPNIATLFDGGVTDDGTPYYVMELVEGKPLDEYCDEEQLDVGERMALFVQVCEAVGYAHERSIVHRDIKPPNILVADGRVKLLDFGIAKLLEGAPGSEGTQTSAGLGPMTPEYASPEQLRGGAITPATDVYALGVLMHELLTGVLPYQKEGESKLALANAICEQPISRPSARFARASTVGREGLDPESIASARRTSAPALRRRIRGDLDTIVLAALRKEPWRRYENATMLGADIRRHLDGFPVQARRESVVYRASRFLRRHRTVAAVSGVSLVSVSVLVAVALSLASSNTLKSEEIERGRERARELLTHLTELYEVADPDASPTQSAATRGLLDVAAERLTDDSTDDPETRATLLFAAGRVYRRMGAMNEGMPLLEESLRLRRDLYEAPSEELAEVLYELGSCKARADKGAEGVEHLGEALEMERALHGDDHAHVAQVRYERAVAYHNTGVGGNAGAEFREAVRVYRALSSEPSREYASALMALGDWLAVTRSIPEATELYQEALEISKDLFGPKHATVARALNGLGMLYYNSARKEDGIESLRQSIATHRRVFGEPGHPDMAWSLVNLGAILNAEGESEEGVVLLREALSMYRSHGTDAATEAHCLTSLGTALRETNAEEAAEAYEEALTVYERGQAMPMFQVGTKNALASLLRERGRSERAIELLAEVAETYESALGPDHRRTEAARERLKEAETD